jgi:DNA-binding CsgD family transcriptional regulator
MFHASIAASAHQSAPTHPAASAANALLCCLIDEIDSGILLCDGEGIVRVANQAARRELNDGRLLCWHGTAVACTALEGGPLQRALRAAAQHGRRQMVLLERTKDWLLTSVVPLPQADGAEPLVLLLMGRREPCSAIGLELFGTAHGLTLAERRVLAALLRDASPREVAAEHGVALSTIRTQILSLRAKLGARSIEGLLLRAAGIPPVAAALRHVPRQAWPH